VSKYWLFRLAAAVVPRIPYNLLYALVGPLAWLLWVSASRQRRRVEFNLRHVPSLAEDLGQLHQATRQVFRTTILNYIEFLRGPSRTDAEVIASYTVEGQEALEEALREGRGAILVSGHYGAFELSIARLGAMGYSVVAPAERLKPERLYQFMRRFRENNHFRFVPADERETVVLLKQALARNEIVAFGVDRYVAGASTAEIPFFGEPAKMAVTPMALALHMRVPVIVAVGWHIGRNRYHGVIRRLDLGTLYEQAHVRTAEEANRYGASSVAELKQRAPVEGQRLFLEQFERFILARPGQWVSALARVWPEPGPVGATAAEENTDANLVRQAGDRTSISAYNGSRAAATNVPTNAGLASSPQPSS
jgi:phosphatidylinositol dimannoside acyltransferase